VNEVPSWLRLMLRKMHEEIRGEVRGSLGSQAQDFLASEAGPGAGDVSYQVDVRPENIVADYFRNAPETVVVVCEGLGRVVFPALAQERDAQWCVIIDPLDGSREICYSKRSAWVLSGVAAAHPAPTLADIAWAIQTEIPPLAQTTGVMITAGPAQQPVLDTCDLVTGVVAQAGFGLQSSGASSVRGGFAVFADYFAGSHALMGRVTDQVFDQALGKVSPGESQVFNDQYLSTAGCLYLIATGKYRFFADIRPVIGHAASQAGRNVGLCAHPYDLCTYAIAQQAGVIVTDPHGSPLSYVLDTDTDCGWVGYANSSIRDEMEGPLLGAIAQLMDGNTPGGTNRPIRA
jgi:hypothetical protein